MLVIDPKLISKPGGLYNLQADQNLAELKSIMKDIIVNERPSSSKPSPWTDLTVPTKKDASTNTTVSSSSGDREYAYPPPPQNYFERECNTEQAKQTVIVNSTIRSVCLKAKLVHCCSCVSDRYVSFAQGHYDPNANTVLAVLNHEIVDIEYHQN
ncbi:unnamed protein product [Phytophthora lilii]|uniref:Unnamed protein product n=1 Tax=Phytophthora lilii TaxID=2077276 RepID=A0A9W6WPA9_9STRA|nr:unnamed protein product [Phytophthora lilii]